MDASVSKTDLNLWIAFADETKAQRLYAAYAQTAINEGHPEVAETFMEAAGDEAVHAMVHLKALAAVKSTADNLRRVIEEEARESEQNYPRYIAEAQREGRTEAVAAFQLALNRERHHITLFQNALHSLERKTAIPASNGPAKTTAASPPESALHRAARAGEAKMHGPAEVREERQRIASRSRIRELVFGAQDGVLTTVGVVSAFFGATERNSTILLAGLASGFAGMVAMTAGSYLSSKAEDDVERSEIRRERKEITENPAEELAELVEIYRQQGMSLQQARDAALHVASDPQLMLKVLVREELGLDLEPKGSPVKNAGVMALSFLSGAVFPIAPYVLLHGLPAFFTSIFVAAAALFGVGVIKARVADTNQLRSGLETFVIGTLAGVLGYILGTLIPKALGVNFMSG